MRCGPEPDFSDLEQVLKLLARVAPRFGGQRIRVKVVPRASLQQRDPPAIMPLTD